MARKRRQTWVKNHRVGPRLVAGVMLLQGAMLLTFLVTRHRVLPPRVRVFELFWAWMQHEPIFYPLVALLVGAPAMTLLALRIPGAHRFWLVASWVVFIAIVSAFYHERMITMLRALYWAMTH